MMSDDGVDGRSISHAIMLLEIMANRGGSMCHDAVQTLWQLVSAHAPAAKVGGPLQCPLVTVGCPKKTQGGP